MKLKHTLVKWIVRKTVDESGDYPFPTYDILAIHKWGPEAIACAYQNPYNARLIASAPDMLEALIEYIEWGAMTQSDRDLHENKFKKLIEVATGEKIEDVMEDK